MTALNKCLLYVFLCVAIFCEIDSKGQIPNDGVINIDDTLKGEVIEGSGRGFEDDVDQEEASGGLEDDEDTPLLSSSVPQRGRSPTGRQTDSTFFEFGSGDHGGRQGNHEDDENRDHDRFGATITTTTTTGSPSLSSSSASASQSSIFDDDDDFFKRGFLATNPPPPPTLPPAAPSSSLAPTTTATSTTTTTTTTVPTTTTSSTTSTTPYREPLVAEDDDDEDVNVGSGFHGSNNIKETQPSWSHSAPSRPTTTTTTSTTTTTTKPTTWGTTTSTTSEFEWGWGDEKEEEVEKEEEEPFGHSPSDNDDEDDVTGIGSGDSPVVKKKPEEEVSKPPTTHFKPRKPDPTNFVTRYTPDKKNEFDDEKNKINEDGGTGYDEKDRNDDDYMNNNIPMIEKSVMGPKQQKHDSSLWKQPGILAGIIGAAVVGLLCAVLLVMFIVYRMRKKDEGSYDLDETTKRSPRINGYQRTNQNEFYA